jgi:hypothetical protein
MEQNHLHNELENDQKLAEQLFSKESLSQFNESKVEAPHFYFENFSARVLNKIEKANQGKAKIFTLSRFSKYAVAATLLFAVATTFIITNKSLQPEITDTKVADINIQEISNEEIEAYVNDNESIAEVDWQSELSKYSNHVDPVNGSNDTIETNLE